jgi:hypothetical protein
MLLSAGLEVNVHLKVQATVSSGFFSSGVKVTGLPTCTGQHTVSWSTRRQTLAEQLKQWSIFS